MSASRQIRERNERAAKAREEERRERDRQSFLGHEAWSSKAEKTVLLLLDRLKGTR